MTNLYSVEYISNGGSNIPSRQEVETTEPSQSFTVPADIIPTREGYSFRGWSINSADTTGNTIYDPGNAFTVSNTTPDVKLYAIWQKVTNKLTELGTMQNDKLSSYCSQTTTPSKWDTISGVPEAQLTDTRDGSTYWVAKLADGNCWMTQNLALGLEGKTLTSSNSDVSSNWSGASNVSSALWSDGNSDTIKWYHSDTGSGHSSYGNYYSWGAATAGTGNKITSTNSDDYPVDASDSICPKGWKLPVISPASDSSSKDKSYRRLLFDAYGLNDNAAGSAAIRKAPLYFVFSGVIYGNELHATGSSGFYWLSTAGGTYTAAGAYDLTFHPSSVNPFDNNYRCVGMSVRCVAK